MTATSAWEDAWNAAQPLPQPPLSTGDCDSTRTLRVGLLDSELLDLELANLLQEPLGRALSAFSTSLRASFEPELALMIQMVLYKLSLWSTGASYGASLQGLRYVMKRSHKSGIAPSGLPKRILLLHGLLTIVLPYVNRRIRAYCLSRAWPDAPSSDRRRRAWTFLTTAESAHSVLALLSFIGFLWNGRYRTLADRILGMQLVPSRNLLRRDVSYEFMNRQMVWHSFTEFLLFVLPLLSGRAFRRFAHRTLANFSIHGLNSILPSSLRGNPIDSKSSKSSKALKGPFWPLSRDQCAICAQNASYSLDATSIGNSVAPSPYDTSQISATPPDTSVESTDEPPRFPIHNPYIASCGDIYCYQCLAEEMLRAAEDGLEDQSWTCLRCTLRVSSAERRVIEPDYGSDFSEFTSNSDLDDLSGSFTNYSESGLSDV